MPDIPYQHAPVMADEVVAFLQPLNRKLLVDCTLGGGGHAEKIKAQNPKIKIYGIDRDIEAIEAAKQRLGNYKDIKYLHDNFSNIKKHIKEKVDGILFDLGVSSYQIDEAGRGFSFQKEGPLDMRMDKSQKLTAFDVINTYRIEELERIIKEYGEERFAKRIAKAITAQRPINSHTKDFGVGINTTFQLKEIVEKAIPTWRKRETVTRVFQALRIAVNSELENLEKALKDAVEILRPGGRIVVISYHSLEDRILKHTFRNFARDGILKLLTKKPIIPSVEEVDSNPRAKSAKLRAAVRA